MPSVDRFLIVDIEEESSLLLGRTLSRKFPHAVITECPTLESALEYAALQELTGIVVHRAVGVDGSSAVRELRRIRPDVPIVMVSTVNRQTEALDAGATRFLLFSEWLRVGTLLHDLTRPRPEPAERQLDPDANIPAHLLDSNALRSAPPSSP